MREQKNRKCPGAMGGLIEVERFDLSLVRECRLVGKSVKSIRIYFGLYGASSDRSINW